MEVVGVIVVLVFVWVVGKSRLFRKQRPVPRESPPTRKRLPPVIPPNDRRKPYNTTTSKPQIAPRTIEGAAYVIDGDSLVIQKTQVRLFGIDAPEMNHPFGVKSKWAMYNLVKGQKIRAEITDTDDYGRTVAKCYLPDGRDLSAELVKIGLAIDWPKFSGGVYRALEVPDARKKMWLANARQKGWTYIVDKYEAQQKQRGK